MALYSKYSWGVGNVETVEKSSIANGEGGRYRNNVEVPTRMCSAFLCFTVLAVACEENGNVKFEGSGRRRYKIPIGIRGRGVEDIQMAKSTSSSVLHMRKGTSDL